MKSHYQPNNLAAAGQETQKVFNFAATIQLGDIVLAGKGDNVLGIGEVTGNYYYSENSDWPHRRQVKWLSVESWKLPETEMLQSAIYQIKKTTNQIEVERKLLSPPQEPQPAHQTPTTTIIKEDHGKKIFRVPPLEGISGRIQAILERKKQIILYGPPGTGKTYWADRTANDLAAYAYFGKQNSELSDSEKALLHAEPRRIRKCTFHPAYGYEDFLEGYRPIETNGQLAFEKRDGIFKRLCDDAGKDTDEHPYYLLIDEINRGDIPRIFGELLTLLEKDKRGSSVILPLSGDTFVVPPNVYLIGTMNTADRSIALLDTALRRRFGFFELMPDINILSQSRVRDFPLGPWLGALNKRICQFIGRDARNLQIGHAYFMVDGKPVSDYRLFINILDEDVFPLLEEYCYEDYEALEKILGKSLVDKSNQCIKRELLDPGSWDELTTALLALTTDLVTSTAVVASEADQPEDENEESTEDATNG